MGNVYAVFEERQVSCNPDYHVDGFIIVWDSEELGRNMSTCELMKIIKSNDDETFDKLVQHLKDEYKLDYYKDKVTIDELYFTEVLDYLIEELGDSGFYKFSYQTISSLKEIHKSKEKADEMVKYYTENYSYSNRHYVVKYNLLD